VITFQKSNDVYLTFDGDRSDMQTLSDYFTFQVDGYQFTPAYRNKYWDGKIRLANLRDRTIYAGLVSDIAKFSKDCEIDVHFEGTKHDMPGIEQDIPDHMLSGFIKALNLHAGGKPIEMRDYQYESFKQAVLKQRMLLLSPTASGKSLVIYALMRWWREIHERKILIIVPTISLVTQMSSDFKDYSQDNFDDMHMITGGVEKNTDKRVVISTWQSIYKQPAGWFAQFGSVIVDEVHHAEAKSIQGIMNKMLICPDRIGLTGTLKEAKTNELVLKGLFGSVYKAISTRDLIDNDQISDMKIQLVRLNYNDSDKKANKGNTYQEEISFLITHDKRNTFVAKLAATLPGNTLCVFSRIDHGKELYEKIQKYTTTEKAVQYVAGETDKESREATRQFAEKNDVIIVASLGVFSTGVNIKNLHNLIFAHPSKSKIKVLQSIGRVLRKTEDGKPATIYDIIDDLKYKSKDNYTLKHAGERFRYYTEEKFDYKISTIDL
jgi:superfamily II DNA or RNA helicase